MSDSKWIVVISDTHGVLPQFVTDKIALIHPAHIIHAGDICNRDISTALKKFAPVTLVRGNMDNAQTGAASAVADVDGTLIYVLHNLYDIDLDPVSAGIAAVVHGHLHIPSIEWRNDILYLNPGSCSYPRGNYPPSIALIEISHGRLQPEILYQR